jgi:hypothetical protein
MLQLCLGKLVNPLKFKPQKQRAPNWGALRTYWMPGTQYMIRESLGHWQ